MPKTTDIYNVYRLQSICPIRVQTCTTEKLRVFPFFVYFEVSKTCLSIGKQQKSHEIHETDSKKYNLQLQLVAIICECVCFLYIGG